MVSSYIFAAVLAVLLVSASAQGYGRDADMGRQGDRAAASFGGRQGQRENYAAGPGELDRQGDNQFRSQIYTQRDLYGYESKFPGGRATFKSYRTDPETGVSSRYSDGQEAREEKRFGAGGRPGF